MIIRFATVDDSAALLRIYARYIDTPVTFECTLPTEEAFRRRMADSMATYPYLVCEEEGQVVGYAYAHRQKEREAYGWNAELSVYLDPSVTARGVGRKLYATLIDMLKLQGIRTVYGVVVLPNARSERLHDALGFRRMGVCRSTGYKGGKWHDVAWYERAIAPYDADPEPIRPIGDVDGAQLLQIFNTYR